MQADEITLPQKWMICVALLTPAALPQPPSSYTFIGHCSKRGLPVTCANVLLASQCHHRINTHGAAGGDVARGECHKRQQHRDGDHR
jgi:hypothetical protein